MQENLSLSNVYAVLVFISCVLSIISVLKSGKKDSQQDGVSDGEVQSDLRYIKQQLEEIKHGMTNTDVKIDRKFENIEKDYRDLLMSNTELIQQYKSLHRRVDTIDQQINNLENKLGGN